MGLDGGVGGCFLQAMKQKANLNANSTMCLIV